MSIVSAVSISIGRARTAGREHDSCYSIPASMTAKKRGSAHSTTSSHSPHPTPSPSPLAKQQQQYLSRHSADAITVHLQCKVRTRISRSLFYYCSTCRIVQFVLLGARIRTVFPAPNAQQPVPSPLSHQRWGPWIASFVSVCLVV